MITPSTTIKFLNTPFSLSQNNVLKFDSLQSQQNYMFSKVVYTISGCKYQREGNGEYIILEKSIDQLYMTNYVMFQNSNYTDKWFYAFIDKMEYVNPRTTKVYIIMDVYQTFQFNFNIQKGFIERQTFDTDYYNTLADTPSTGDLKCVYQYEKTLNGAYFMIFNADPTKDDSSSSSLYYPIINNYSMPCVLAFAKTPSRMAEICQEISNKGRADRIQACYYAPWINDLNIEIALLDKGDLNISGDFIETIKTITLDRLNEVINFNIPYTPVFKKEIAYPYAKLEIVDKITGKFIELDLSKFDNPLSPTFSILYNICGRAEYKVIPLNYNGIAYGIENALVITPDTELPIFSNSYAKYLKNNGTSNIINGVMSGVGLVGAIATGNVAGAVGSFASIASAINADSVARSQPNQVSGIKGDAFDYVNYNPSILFRLKVMDDNHMDIARNFWNAFGYPVRKVTTYSNTNQKFNFIKTVEANIIADTIPSEYQRALEEIFNKGVTIWNRDYLNYSIT